MWHSGRQVNKERNPWSQKDGQEIQEQLPWSYLSNDLHCCVFVLPAIMAGTQKTGKQEIPSVNLTVERRLVTVDSNVEVGSKKKVACLHDLYMGTRRTF